MTQPEKYTCAKCGKEMITEKPTYAPERSEDGKQRVFRTMPELCDGCREKRFWRDIEQLDDGDYKLKELEWRKR